MEGTMSRRIEALAGRLLLSLAVLTVGGLVAWAPASAGAAVVAEVGMSADGKRVTYNSMSDRAIDVKVQFAFNAVAFSEYGGTIAVTAGAAAAGCAPHYLAVFVYCPMAAIDTVEAYGSSKADKIKTYRGWGSVPRIPRAIYFGNGGDDVLIGGSAGTPERPSVGPDELYGGAGNDTLVGVSYDTNLIDDSPEGPSSDPNSLPPDGSNTLIGGEGSDKLYGGPKFDWLIGDEANAATGGDDRLWGGGFEDAEIGGLGDDLYGGFVKGVPDRGADVMIDDFGASYPGGGWNTFVAYGDGSQDYVYCAPQSGPDNIDIVFSGGDFIGTPQDCEGILELTP
jgi:hypothetical protein